MKKINTIICILISIGINAQVSIEKDNVDGVSTILDFASGTNKGIILPKTNDVSNMTPGSITFDRIDKMVKLIYNNSTAISMNSNTGNFDASRYDFTGNEVGESVIIGSHSSTANGVLILESNDKAMILPKVENPSLNIRSPEPGTICYDTLEKAVAVFNGTEWTYWY